MALAMAQLDNDSQRRRRRERARLWTALPLSILGHVAVVSAVLALSAALTTPRPVKPKVRPVSIRNLSSDEWTSNRKFSPSRSSASTVAAPSRPAPIPKGQVVDVAPGNNKVSENAKYLAETNNTVKKETRAREQTNLYSHATPKNTPHPEMAAVAKGSVGGRSAPQVSGAHALDLLEGTQGFRPRLSQLMQEATVGEKPSNLDAPERAGNEAGENEQVKSGDRTEAGGGAPNDDLSNVEKGDGTFLNTREWKYAGFFNRVKQAVSARWDPMGRLRAKNPKAGLGFSDRVTVLTVTLRPDGSIQDIFVSQTSGIEQLDVESVAAFEKAQPFANPPAGLVENGVIRFAFGFKVTNEQAGGLPNMFRPGG